MSRLSRMSRVLSRSISKIGTSDLVPNVEDALADALAHKEAMAGKGGARQIRLRPYVPHMRSGGDGAAALRAVYTVAPAEDAATAARSGAPGTGAAHRAPDAAAKAPREAAGENGRKTAAPKEGSRAAAPATATEPTGPDPDRVSDPAAEGRASDGTASDGTTAKGKAPEGAAADGPRMTAVSSRPMPSPETRRKARAAEPGAGADDAASWTGSRSRIDEQAALLLAATRLGEGPMQGRPLSRRAEARMASDPFVQRLGKLR
jgi:hypothetical protein